MKKFLSVFISFIISVTLCSCSQSDKEFSLDLSYWSNSAENADTVPMYNKGNAVITTIDGVDTGGKELAEIIEKTAIVPAENTDLAQYDIPQLVYQAEFIKYHDTEILPIDKEKQELVYVVRFYDDFKYMAVFSDVGAENRLSPVYAIEDGTALREYYQSRGHYITPRLLNDVKTFIEESFSGKGRDYIRTFISDMLLPFFLQEIPEDIVFTPDYNRIYTGYFGDENIMICGFTDFREDVYSYIIFADIDENGSLSTDNVMFMLYTDNP